MKYKKEKRKRVVLPENYQTAQQKVDENAWSLELG